MRAALVGLWLLTTSAASAQPVQSKEESDDLFGFGKPDDGVALDCRDGEDFGCAYATDPLEAKTSPFALSSVITPARWRDLAVSDSTHETIVPFALAASRDDVGVFFGGATGWETRGFVEGAATDSLETGGIETNVPLLFVDAIRVTAGGFGPADRTGTGGTVDVDLIRGGAHHDVDAEVWASGSTHPDALHAPLGFTSITAELADRRSTSVGLAARGPITRVGGARLWYAAGIRPLLRDDSLVRDARGFVDLDLDGVPDTQPDGTPVTQEIEHRTLSDYAFAVPILARVGAERGAHSVDLTALATPSRDTQWRGIGTVEASSAWDRRLTLDGIAAWRGTWSRTRARVIASWHHRRQDEESRSAAAEVANVEGDLPLASELPAEAALAAGCDDSSDADPWPTIENCSPIRFLTGGPGRLFGRTDDRWSIVGDVSHKIDNHVLAAGVSAEYGRETWRERYTGGELQTRVGSETVFVRRLVEVAEGPDTFPCDDDPATPEQCRVADFVSDPIRTRHLAVYASDEWRPRADYAFTGGVRWEAMKLGDALSFSDQIAPRVGFAWDPLGGGRSRVFAGFGRSYAVMPVALAARIGQFPPTMNISNFGGTSSISFFDGGDGEFPIDPGIAPIVSEELTTGVVLALREALRITAWGQVRWIRRGIEDVRNDDGDFALELANPVDPSATRQSDMVAVELATAPARRFGFRIQYQYGRSVGAVPGAYDATVGGTPYLTETYDMGIDNANLVGPLPSDVRHRAVVEGTARFSVGPVPLVVGIRAITFSGRPVNVLGQDDIFVEKFYLLPRGRGGRLGLVTSTNLHVAASLGHGFELVADVYNVFDRQRATAVNELYAEARALQPIIDGTPEDLIFLHANDEDGTLVGPSPTYGLPTARQAPLSAAIGVRARF